MNQAEDKVVEKWNTFFSLTERLGRPGLSEMATELGERIALCPASQNKEYPGCHPGGLVELSLSITSKMRALNKALNLEVDQESLILVGLYHSIGFVGSRTEPFLVDHTSNWHRDRGIMYDYNQSLPKSPVSHRSLQLLQEFGVRLSFDEWVSIAVSGGPGRDESKFYTGTEPPLAILLQQARQWVNR